MQNTCRPTKHLIAYRDKLVEMMSGKVSALNRENFAVRQHLKYVDLYADAENYKGLTYEDTLLVREEVAPLILPDGDEINAVRFDALMYGMELSHLAGKKYTRAQNDLMKRVKAIAGVANIPEIQMKSELVRRILDTGYVEDAGIEELEHIREELRDLMKYVPQTTKMKYVTDFTDLILSKEWRDAELDEEELANCRAKAEFYVREHQDHFVIAKLKANRPLTQTDIRSLEEIL